MSNDLVVSAAPEGSEKLRFLASEVCPFSTPPRAPDSGSFSGVSCTSIVDELDVFCVRYLLPHLIVFVFVRLACVGRNRFILRGFPLPTSFVNTCASGLIASFRAKWVNATNPLQVNRAERMPGRR